ncbi:pseudouridine synthase [Flammula alnicola]|nr:pseudouridine synthase [Flammula alnicola]
MAVKRFTQREVYQRLHGYGSPWLKSHVLFADRQIVVLNKPPGLVSQVDRSHYARNSEYDLVTVFEDIKRWFSASDPYPVHRLDKMTTGCLLIPITYTSVRSLSLQFRQRTVKKSYLALVRGGERSFPTSSGEIDSPLLYTDGRGAIHSDGKQAITRWELVASSPKAPVSLLKLHLITGYKHQLRIHLAQSLKTPILGDTLYSQTPLHASVTSMTTVPEQRLFLHGSDISFFRYKSGGKRYRLGLRAPVPADFADICQDLDIALPPERKKAALLINDQIDEDESSGLLLWDPQRTY